MDHAIVVADAAGIITWWSPGAELLFGHSASAAVGQKLDLIVPELCADGQVKVFAGRLLVLSDGLGSALGAMAIFAAAGTTGFKPFG